MINTSSWISISYNQAFLNSFLKQFRRILYFGALLAYCFPISSQEMNKSINEEDHAQQLNDALLLILSRTTNSAAPRVAFEAVDEPPTEILSEMPKPQVTDEELDQEFNEAVSFLSRATNSGEKRIKALAELAEAAERSMAPTFRSLQPLTLVRSNNQSTDSTASSTGSSICPTPSTHSNEIHINLDFLPYDSHNPHPDSTRHRTRAGDHYQPAAESHPPEGNLRKLARVGIALSPQERAALLAAGEKMSGIAAPPSSPRGGLSSSSSRDTSPFNPTLTHSSERSVPAQNDQLRMRTSTTSRTSDPSQSAPARRPAKLATAPLPPSSAHLKPGERGVQLSQAVVVSKIAGQHPRNRNFTVAPQRFPSDPGNPTASTSSFEGIQISNRPLAKTAINVAGEDRVDTPVTILPNTILQEELKKNPLRIFKTQSLDTLLKSEFPRILAETLPPDAKALLRGYLMNSDYKAFLPRFKEPACHCLMQIDQNKLIQTISITLDGKTAFIAAEGGRAELVDLSNPDKPVSRSLPIGEGSSAALQKHLESITSSNFSPNGNWLITGGEDGSVVAWNLVRGEYFNLSTRVKHHNLVSSVSISDVNRALSGSLEDEGQVIFYQSIYSRGGVDEIDAIPLKGHQGKVTTVHISPDGTCGLSGGPYDNAAIWWDLSNRHAITGLKLQAMKYEQVKAQKAPKDQNKKKKPKSPKKQTPSRKRNVFPMAWSTDTQLVFTAENENMTLWDIKNRKAYQIKGQASEIISLATEGRWIIAGTIDGFVRIFDISDVTAATSYLIEETQPVAEIFRVALAPDCSWAAFTTDHKESRRQLIKVVDLLNPQTCLIRQTCLFIPLPNITW